MSKEAIEQKKLIVDEIKKNIEESKGVVFVSYQGINVADDTKLRQDFRAKDVKYKIYKNRLIKLALDELGITGYDATHLEGNTSIAFGKDEVSAAGVLFDNMKKVKALDAKFGIISGEVVGREKVEALSKIPTKEVLVAQLLSMLLAPVSSLARALDAISKKGA